MTNESTDKALAELWMWVQEQSGKNLDESKLLFAGRLLAEAERLGLWREWKAKLNMRRRCAHCYSKGKYTVKIGDYCHVCGGDEELC